MNREDILNMLVSERIWFVKKLNDQLTKENEAARKH